MRSAARISLIVMGPAGAGKTTVGGLLAQRLEADLLDADDFHSPQAIQKMRQGLGLTEADRDPWLSRLRAALDRAEGPFVLCCSALRASYRTRLGAGGQRRLVYLHVPEPILQSRLEERQGHFAGAELLKSQLAALEPPEPEDTYDGTAPPEEIVKAVLTRLGVDP